MRFFIPEVQDRDEADKVYEAIKRFVQEQAGSLRDARYYAIYYRHNGKDMKARIGEPEPLTGETVIAIFRTDRDEGPFLICTENRGVVRGEPILANGNARTIPFEE